MLRLTIDFLFYMVVMYLRTSYVSDPICERVVLFTLGIFLFAGWTKGFPSEASETIN